MNSPRTSDGSDCTNLADQNREKDGRESSRESERKRGAVFASSLRVGPKQQLRSKTSSLFEAKPMVSMLSGGTFADPTTYAFESLLQDRIFGHGATQSQSLAFRQPPPIRPEK